jgi:tetratricopeptide (TPR) repeat protein
VYALALYERAVVLDSKRPNAPTGKGLALLGLKQYNEALDAFELASSARMANVRMLGTAKALLFEAWDIMSKR